MDSLEYLTQTSTEFTKLEPSDRRVCLYVLENNASELPFYINYTINIYRKKGIEIDSENLLNCLNSIPKDKQGFFYFPSLN